MTYIPHKPDPKINKVMIISIAAMILSIIALILDLVTLFRH
jgi:hypothetical protein